MADWDCHVCGQWIDTTRSFDGNGNPVGDPEQWAATIPEDEWPHVEHAMVFHQRCYDRFTQLQTEMQA